MEIRVNKHIVPSAFRLSDFADLPWERRHPACLFLLDTKQAGMPALPGKIRKVAKPEAELQTCRDILKGDLVRMNDNNLSRRLFLSSAAVGVVGSAAFFTPGVFAEHLTQTPAQTEGPF